MSVISLSRLFFDLMYRGYFVFCVILLVSGGRLFIQPTSSARSSTATASSFTTEINEIKFWSQRFGKDIKDGSSEATCLRKIVENYNEMGANAVNVEASKILEEMRTDLQNMLKWKKTAVAKIAAEAEKLAANHSHVKNLDFSYKNAKRLYDPRYEPPRGNASVIELSYHPNFQEAKVNTFESVIHVPVNVWEQGSTLINQIAWSEGLTQVFRNNLAYDPNLNWQYFGSSEGFLRLFPAAKWRTPVLGYRTYPASQRDTLTPNQPEGSVAMGLDLYDARMRHWFIRAAAFPKDMIILLDGSGSMTGQRKEIAKNVVLNILQTLTDDDYVAVTRFGESLEPVAPCFGNELVPATRQNIREFRDQMEGLNTSDIANFTLALSHAFDTLNRYYTEDRGTRCNQLIMLITDGAPETYKEVFEKYNWPRVNVRVFTYLVGREVTETKEINWMACHNRGYYTHVANLAEVREQVQLYIPVLARPMVLTGPEQRQFIWTPAYAEVSEVGMSNWLWDERIKARMRANIRARILRERGGSAEITETPPAGEGEVEEGEEEEEGEGGEEEETPEVETPSPAIRKGKDGKKNLNPTDTGDTGEAVIIEAEAEGGDYEEEDDEEREGIRRKPIRMKGRDQQHQKHKYRQKRFAFPDPAYEEGTRKRGRQQQGNNRKNMNKRATTTTTTVATNDVDDTEGGEGEGVVDGEVGPESPSVPLIPSSPFDAKFNPPWASSEEEGLRKKRRRMRGINTMTTVAAPIYDLRKTTNITVRVLVKNIWEEQEKEIRTANLLGIAGVDVPIREIKKYVPAYKLGVNGYAFATTNNGFLLFHPDLRPLFQDMLKPFYSAMDVTKVEFPDKDSYDPLNKPDPAVEALRKNMIDRVIGWKKMDMKIHMDGLRRIVARTHSYYYGAVNGTPFSLAISLPDPYGHARVDGQIEVKRADKTYRQYFAGENWRVHPDWVYCEQNPASVAGIVESPEEMIRLFLEKVNNTNKIRWRTSSIHPHASNDQLTCEKDLIQSLVFDAKATQIDPKKCGTPKTPSKYEKEITKTYGISLTFTATRSGLTRFENHIPAEGVGGEVNIEESSEEDGSPTPSPQLYTADETIFYENEEDLPFQDVHNKAIDEVFYRRAVDYEKVNSSAFVYSVNPDAGSRLIKGKETYVTATRAIFIGTSKPRAPVAVVGLLYSYKMFAERFFNHTTRCGSKECRVKCSEEMYDCLLVDNNGYIIVSEDKSLVGKLLTEYDSSLLDTLVTNKVMLSKRIHDWQAVCIESYQVSGPASFLMTPFDLLRRTIMWMWAKLSMAAVDLYLNGFINSVFAADETTSNPEDTTDETAFVDIGGGSVVDEGKTKFINKTKPRPCVKEYELFDINPKFIESDSTSIGTSKCLSGCSRTYIAQPVPFSNLFSLVVMNTCKCPGRKLVPRQVSYPGDCTGLPGRLNKDYDNTIEDDGSGKNPVTIPFYRRREPGCINRHNQENDIKLCGGGVTISISQQLLVMTLTVVVMTSSRSFKL